MTNSHRLTSRILLFDESGRFLLFNTKAPDTSGFSRWITPGGGVDPGETQHAAAVRELFEETGLEVADLGEPVWSHDFDVTWDDADHDTGHAEFYVHETARFEPSSAHWTPEEHIDVVAYRWWSSAELVASGEPFEPAELIQLVWRNRPLPTFTIDELELLDASLESFTNEDAVALGMIAVEVIRESGLNLAVDIVRGDDLVYRAKLGSTGPENDEWLAGKAAAAIMFGEPSLLVRLRHEAADITFTDLDLDHAKVKGHGGSIPIRVGDNIVGTITMSGEPDVLDHANAAAALRRYRSRVRG
jgi:uncharacterized protein (UPF0303 family)/8-oxo-dGTP pyrophosphatase MutT (NUDIX family)